MSVTPGSGDALYKLATHLHARAEEDKASLARQLHDHLGGLLLGALMDAAWAERHLPLPADESLEKLRRIRHSLGIAIDLKRKIVEDLRPTLLDNVGLFAALRWLMRGFSEETALSCTVAFPESEPHLESALKVALFRFVQEALRLVWHKLPQSLELSGVHDASVVMVRVIYRGESLSIEQDSAEFASMRHRVEGPGGELRVEADSSGRTSLCACLSKDAYTVMSSEYSI